MAIPTFTPLRAPRPGTTNKPKLNLWTAEFGDGYTASCPAGLNHIRRELTLGWDTLTPAEAATITDFFKERGGYKAFFYTPSDEATPVRWRCAEWEDKRVEAGFREISATFAQDFGLHDD